MEVTSTALELARYALSAENANDPSFVHTQTHRFDEMTSASTHLLEFKAGRCFRTTGTDTVKPDPTKGLVVSFMRDL